MPPIAPDRPASESANALAQANLGLLRRVAWRYYTNPSYRRRLGDDLGDYFQIGWLGLRRAAETWDPTLGRFSTHAWYHIRAALQRAAARSTPIIRVPAYLQRQVGRIDHGLAPNGPWLNRACLAAAARVLHARRLSFAANDPFALHLEDPQPGPLDQAVRREDGILTSEQRAAFHALPKRQRDLLIRRFGLDGQPPESRPALARRMGVTRERIRQIEQEALQTLKRTMGPDGNGRPV